MSRAPLDHDAALVDCNVVESIREFGRWQRDSMIVEEDGVLLVSGTTDSPVGYANCAARVDPEVRAELVLERARDFFHDDGRGFTLWVRGEADADLEGHAAAEGLSRVSESAWLVLEGAAEPARWPTGTTFELVDDEQGIREAAAVNREAYQSLGFDPAEADAIYGLPSRAVGPQVITCVARQGGRPVATAMALLTAHVAGIYWVGTVPAARRQGLGAACTIEVHAEALRRGVRLSTLQASQMGQSMYESIGYRRVSFHRWYLSSPPA